MADSLQRALVSVRASAKQRERVTIFARSHKASLGKGWSFDLAEPDLTGAEWLLGALASDVIGLFLDLAARRRVTIDEVEATLKAELANPLVHLGVVGAEGETRYTAFSLRAWAGSPAAEPLLAELWAEAVRRAPLANTSPPRRPHGDHLSPSVLAIETPWYRLTPHQEAIVARARSIADSVLTQHAADVDANGRFPHESMKALADAGMWGLLVPAEFGGMGQSMRVLAAVVDEIAQRCASTAMVFMMHHSGVNCYLAEPAKFASLLREVAAGRHLSTLAFSEKGSRSQFWAPVSKAQANGSGVTLSAEKSWVTSAGLADGIVASCGSEAGPGPSVYLVRKTDHGVTVSGGWNSLGMRGNQSNPMTFKEVALDPAERLIGTDGKGDDIMLGKALPVFQVCQGAIGAGLAEAAFAAAQKHLTSHGFEHTGTMLRDLPNLRAQLAEMRLETDKARAYLVATLDKLEAGAADAMLHALAVKASSGETAVLVSDLAMRTCGGAAFSKHLGLERVFRDARAAIVMAPTTDHLREFCGRVLVGLPLFG